MSSRLIRRPEVRALTGLATSTLYRLIAENRFPRPIQIAGSSHMVAWDSAAVDSWIAEQIRAAELPVADRPTAA